MTKSKPRINEILFYPVIPTATGLVCYVSFTLNNSIRINDVGIYTRPTGSYRLLYPIKQLKNGKVISSVYPINKEIGKALEDFLFTEYNKFLKKHVK